MLQLLKNIFVTFPLALLRGILFVPNVLIRRLIAFFSDPFSMSFQTRRSRKINSVFRQNGQDSNVLLRRIHNSRLQSNDLYFLNLRPPIDNNRVRARQYAQKACYKFVQPSDDLLQFAVNDRYTFNAKELDVIARALGSLDGTLIADNSIGNVIRRLKGKKTEHDKALTNKIKQIENVNRTSPPDIYLSHTIDRQNLENNMHRCQVAIGLLEKAALNHANVPVADFLGRYQNMQQATLDAFNSYALSARDVPDRAAEQFERVLGYLDAGPNGDGIDSLRVTVPETSSVIRKYTDRTFVESEMKARRFFAHTCIHAMMRMPNLLEFSRAPYNLFGTSDHSLTFAVNQLLKTRNEIMSKRQVNPEEAMRILFQPNRFTGLRQFFWYRPIDEDCLHEAYESVRNRMQTLAAGPRRTDRPQPDGSSGIRPQ